MAKKVNEHIEDLSDDSKAYLRSLIEYYKLDALKKSTKAIAALLRIAINGSVLLLLFMFLSIGLSFFIGELIDSIGYGFMIMGGFYLTLLIIFAIISKPLSESLSLKFINKIIYSDNDDANNQESGS